ncbi:hypothetical protein [Caballeronia arvi]|nr:hypothetical protein [Caballeronia arvi]
MKPELTAADADAIETLNYIIRLGTGVCALCVVGIARLTGLL